MKCLWHSLCIYFTSTIAKWIIKSIKLNSSAKPPYHEFKYVYFNMWRSPRKIFPGLIQNSYFFSNLELYPIMSLFRGHTWRNILYRGHWKLIFQSWNESQKKKVFVRKTHVEEATASINFVSRSFEINFPIMNWIRIKQGLCSEDTCGGSNDL